MNQLHVAEAEYKANDSREATAKTKHDEQRPAQATTIRTNRQLHRERSRDCHIPGPSSEINTKSPLHDTTGFLRHARGPA